jgi:hypothetical protein
VLVRSEVGAMSSKVVTLSQRELMYLKNVNFLSPTLARVVDSVIVTDKKAYTLSVPCATAEMFRSEFTERLAEVGFDVDYEPTSEGKILETLIDIFYSEQT